jgi:RimJ/RimL family protein N-acetyltransferase
VAGGEEIVGETRRVRLRRLLRDDADLVAAMVADPEQMRFYARPKTRDEVEAWVEWNLALYEETGFGTWCLESLPGGEFAGYCGIRPLEVDGTPEVELAWHVTKAQWNLGLATEAALIAMRLGFGRFGLERLVAIIHPDNLASRRVAEKLGMADERRLVHRGEAAVVYGIARG